MVQRLRQLWADWQASLWFIPALFTLLAMCAALALIRVDQVLDVPADERGTWLFGGSVDGARGVLQAIAGSIVTVTGTVFSITVVALQLASSQFTPRVLRTFTSDRGVQAVLGMFIGTFTYALLVLRSVRGETDVAAPFVPALSVGFAIALALLSVGALIYYIHHTSRLIQVATIIDRVAANTSHVMRAARAPDGAPGDVHAAVDHTGAFVTVLAATSGYLQHIAPSGRPARDDGGRVMIRFTRGIGDFVLAGSALARVSPPGDDPATLSEAVNRCCTFGTERTIDHDPRYGMLQLADIAVRALSPGINDPTTAVSCIDRLADLLLAAAEEPDRRDRRLSDDHMVLLVPAPGFAELVEIAFAQVRRYGRNDAVVMVHLVRALEQLVALVDERHRQPLVEQAALVLAATECLELEHDRLRLRAAGAWVAAV